MSHFVLQEKQGQRGCRPFPLRPQSPPSRSASFGQSRLTIPNTCSTITVSASLRSDCCSPSLRNAVRFPPIDVHLHRNTSFSGFCSMASYSWLSILMRRFSNAVDFARTGMVCAHVHGRTCHHCEATDFKSSASSIGKYPGGFQHGINNAVTRVLRSCLAKGQLHAHGMTLDAIRLLRSSTNRQYHSGSSTSGRPVSAEN